MKYFTYSVVQNSCKVALVLGLCFNLSGCARNISSDTYSASHVGEASQTYQGVIVAKRQVNVEEGERLQDNTAGLVGGGVGGGLLGSLLGGGKGRVLGAVGGAAAGALAGAYAQKALSQQTAWEYTVKLDNGSLRTVVQGQDTSLSIGQKVLLQVSHGGRSRVTPL